MQAEAAAALPKPQAIGSTTQGSSSSTSALQWHGKSPQSAADLWILRGSWSRVSLHSGPSVITEKGVGFDRVPKNTALCSFSPCVHFTRKWPQKMLWSDFKDASGPFSFYKYENKTWLQCNIYFPIWMHEECGLAFLPHPNENFTPCLTRQSQKPPVKKVSSLLLTRYYKRYWLNKIHILPSLLLPTVFC